MKLLAWLLLALGLAAVVLAVRRVRLSPFESTRDGEVLPAHYSSVAATDRENYPGRCPDCGTDNEPGYRYCRSCGSAVPAREADEADGVADVFEP